MYRGEALFGVALFLALVFLAYKAVEGVLKWLAGGGFPAYLALARARGGRYESREHGAPPTVTFTHKGREARVGMAPLAPNGRKAPARTRVVVKFGPEGLPLRGEILPRNRAASPQPPKGTREIRAPEAVERSLRHGVRVWANDEAMMNQFLNWGRRPLSDLDAAAPGGGWMIAVSPERILFQMDCDLARDTRRLNQFVEIGLALHDILDGAAKSMVALGVEVEFVGDDEVESSPAGMLGPSAVVAGSAGGGPSGASTRSGMIELPASNVIEVKCLVCAEGIAAGQPTVRCEQCRAPYHADCWDFVGVCSVYGCRCRTFTL